MGRVKFLAFTPSGLAHLHCPHSPCHTHNRDRSRVRPRQDAVTTLLCGYYWDPGSTLLNTTDSKGHGGGGFFSSHQPSHDRWEGQCQLCPQALRHSSPASPTRGCSTLELNQLPGTQVSRRSNPLPICLVLACVRERCPPQLTPCHLLQMREQAPGHERERGLASPAPDWLLLTEERVLHPHWVLYIKAWAKVE